MSAGALSGGSRPAPARRAPGGAAGAPGNAADLLVKRAHSLHVPAPEYSVERVGGADHRPLFRAVATWTPDNLSREGLGHSKAEAKRAAAAAIIAMLDLKSRRPALFPAGFYEDRLPQESPFSTELPASGARGAHAAGQTPGLAAGPMQGYGQGAAASHVGNNGSQQHPAVIATLGLPQGHAQAPMSRMPPQPMPQGQPMSQGHPQPHAQGLGQHPLQQRAPMPSQPGSNVIAAGVVGAPMESMYSQNAQNPQQQQQQQGGNAVNNPSQARIDSLLQSLSRNADLVQTLHTVNAQYTGIRAATPARPSEPENRGAQTPRPRSPPRLPRGDPRLARRGSSSKETAVKVADPARPPDSLLPRGTTPQPPAQPKTVPAAPALPRAAPAPPPAAPAPPRAAPAPPAPAQTVPTPAVPAKTPAFRSAPQVTPAVRATIENIVIPRRSQSERGGAVMPQVKPSGSSPASVPVVPLSGPPSLPMVKSEPTPVSQARSSGVSAENTALPPAKRYSVMVSEDPSPAATSHPSMGAASGSSAAVAAVNASVDAVLSDASGVSAAANPVTAAGVAGPLLEQPTRKRARQETAVAAQAPATEGAASAIVGASPVPCVTTVLFLQVDEALAVKATANLAGTAPANILDLQVRAFGPIRPVPTEADIAVPGWMNVTRVHALNTSLAVELSLAFAVGRDAMQLENTGGRIVIISDAPDFASLAVPGFIDVVAPPVLLPHLSSLVPR